MGLLFGPAAALGGEEGTKVAEVALQQRPCDTAPTGGEAAAAHATPRQSKASEKGPKAASAAARPTVVMAAPDPSDPFVQQIWGAP
jgi:hypothetical protein